MPSKTIIMKKKCLLILAFLLIFTQFSFGQSATLGVYFNSTQATGQFNENIEKNPTGILLNGMYNITDSRFSVGGELGVSMYSNRDYTIESNGENVKIHEEDCYYSGKAFVRYNLRKGKTINPFVAGKVGFSTFFSDMVAEEETDAFEDRFVSHGTSFNSCFGLGVQFDLGKIFNFETHKPICFELSANRNYGSNSAYRDIKSNPEATKNIENGKFESKTSHVDLHFGITFNL